MTNMGKPCKDCAITEVSFILAETFGKRVFIPLVIRSFNCRNGWFSYAANSLQKEIDQRSKTHGDIDLNAEYYEQFETFYKEYAQK